MGLEFVNKVTVSGSTSEVNLTGIDSDDVYFFTYRNVQCTTDNSSFRARAIVSGSADTSTNYSRAYRVYKAYAVFANDNANSQGEWFLGQLGTPTQESANGWGYLYNWNSTSKKAMANVSLVDLNSISKLSGNQGGWVYINTGTARTGINFFMSAGNFDTGEFTLYKIT